MMEQFMVNSFLKVLNMSFIASFVIIGVILARLLMKKAPKVFSYVLWTVVLLRLICPFTIESVFSLLPVNAEPIPPGIIYDAVPQIDSGIAVLDRAVNATLPAATPHASMNPMQGNIFTGMVLWVTVAAAILLYGVLSYLLLKRRLRCAMVVDGNIYESEKISSPFVLGILRPRIYLPLGIEGDEYSYIVAHEQTHIRRLDHIVKIVSFGVLCLHWFNPFCWLAFVLMSRDMEMSCDEAVIKWLGSGIRRSYSASLLSLSGCRMLINGSPLAFGESGVKGRIKNIMHYRRPTVWVVAAAVIAAVAVTAGLMLSPKQSDPPVKDATVVDAPASEAADLAEGQNPPAGQQAPPASDTGSEYYRELVKNKAEITKVVALRVGQYRNGTPPDNPNHHPAYPANFPSASQLPVITAPDQFAIREEANLDALGAIYAAVRIDSTHEMRIDISRSQGTDGAIGWSSGNTWLISVSDSGYYSWALTDLDIHGGELPADFMGRALSRGLTEEQVKSLINQSFREEQILNLPMEEIEFTFRRSEAANTVDSEGFTTLDFTQLTSMNEKAESTWVQAGDNFLGMVVKSVYAKGVPYAPYLAVAVSEDIRFTGGTQTEGKFEKRDGGLVFIVAEKRQGGLPARGYPKSNVIVFNNQQAAEARAAELPSAFTDCRISIENYRIQTTNNTVKMIYNEAGEAVDYTADETKTVLVQSADIV